MQDLKQRDRAVLADSSADSETALSGMHTPKQTFLREQPSHFPGAPGVSPTDFASPTWRD